MFRLTMLLIRLWTIVYDLNNSLGLHGNLICVKEKVTIMRKLENDTNNLFVHVFLAGGPLFNPYHADLRNTRDNKFVNEVILSAHFAEEEVDFLLIGNETGADEGWIYSKKMEVCDNVSDRILSNKTAPNGLAFFSTMRKRDLY